MSIRKIVQTGDPRLKKKNKFIVDFSDTKLHTLIQDLKDTMNKTGLVGIAAPQIGENYCVFVTHPRNTKTRNLGKEDIFRVYINPKITYFSKDEVIIYEGCGSVIKGLLFGPVNRSKEITIESYDEKGQKYSLTTNGLLARAIQHEYDHMFGIEFIEKISDYRKIVSQTYYKKNIIDKEETKKLFSITKLSVKYTK